MKIDNKITKQKIEKYYNLTSKAIKLARKAVVKSKQKQAQEIFLMVESYLSDSQYFEKKGDYVNAFAALNYAHGWIDSGVRLDVFDVSDDRLFTVK